MLGNIFLWVFGFATFQLQAQSHTLSHERGFHDEPFDLIIDQEGFTQKIWYTVDGSDPIAHQSLVYNTSVKINSTTLFRFKKESDPKIYTHSYIFLKDIVSASYMSEHITQDPRYIDILEGSFKSLPIISITTEGVPDGHSLIPKDIACSAEMFWPNEDREGFQIDCGVQTWGGSSANPKKNFRIEFKKKYGPSKLRYNIFRADHYDSTECRVAPTVEFDKLLLRAGSQDGLNGAGGNENIVQYVRNRVMYDLQIQMGYPAPHGRFVHLFFNGEYMGQYHLMERPDESFFASYYGGKKDDYEIYKGNKIWSGDVSLDSSMWLALDRKVDYSSPEGVENMRRHIDLEQTADYLLLMSYASGLDWTYYSNNLGGIHKYKDIGGYKFLLYDMDYSLGNGGTFHPRSASSEKFFIAPISSKGPLPNGLMGNDEFHQLLADRMQCHCYGEGVLASDNVNRTYKERISQIKRSVIAESARWGNYDFKTKARHIGTPLWEYHDEFLTEYRRITEEYIPARTEELIDHYTKYQVRSQLEAVEYSRDSGFVPENFNLQLTNPNNRGTIYYTQDGSDPRAFGGAISKTALEYLSPITLEKSISKISARIYHVDDNGKVYWSPMCPQTYTSQHDHKDSR